jgi:hypothetical protein
MFLHKHIQDTTHLLYHCHQQQRKEAGGAALNFTPTQRSLRLKQSPLAAAMDEQPMRSLESKAYYAVLRALAASNKLNFVRSC